MFSQNGGQRKHAALKAGWVRALTENDFKYYFDTYTSKYLCIGIVGLPRIKCKTMHLLCQMQTVKTENYIQN